jgi:hypothetical protein
MQSSGNIYIYKTYLYTSIRTYTHVRRRNTHPVVCGLVAMVCRGSGADGVRMCGTISWHPLEKYPKSTQNLTLAHKRKTQIIDNQ